jgi:hypothetical protein
MIKEIFKRYIERIKGVKVLNTFTKGNVKIVVVYEPDIEEFSARYYVDGKYDEDKTYFAGNDKEDAILKAKSLINQINEQDML